MGFQVGDLVSNVMDPQQGFGRVLGVFPDLKRAQVQFLTGVVMLRWNDLQKVPSDDPESLFHNRQLSGIRELRRKLLRQKISGEQTNVCFSMGNAATEYMPHQFVPVMKFIESTSGNLLIADEVGLGKTVEALYIWQELLARDDSRCLLVVCPASLCEKWRLDMRRYFSIEAEIVKADALLNKLKDAREGGRTRFALIASLSGVACRFQEISKFCDEDEYGKKLIDLLVVDEAHKLKNSASNSHKVCASLREVASHLLLLSATPIQMGTQDLYQLMHLLEPEVFDDKAVFQEKLNREQWQMQMAVAIEKWDEKAFGDACGRFPEKERASLKELWRTVLESPRQKIKVLEILKGGMLYAPYYTRMRRREALEKVPTRQVTTWEFRLSGKEKNLYEGVSRALDERMFREDKKIYKLTILVVQRRLTSCIPAAWNALNQKFKKQDLDDLLVEDFDDEDEADVSEMDFGSLVQPFKDVTFENLKTCDSKYAMLKEKLQKKLDEEPGRKILLFSFYRGTVKYLAERLEEDGIRTENLVGGDGDKQEVIDRFRTGDARVLVATEVLSEGVDLQFCDMEINYDLPWNPMRLEQRIGRIDRIGQKAKNIWILNMSCEDSVDDRVWTRLYARIDIFKNSLGGLEEILGQKVKDLSLSLHGSGVSAEEAEKAAQREVERLAQEVENRRCIEEKMAEKASLSAAFSEVWKGDIAQIRQNGRYIRPVDLIRYVKDYLEREWPGSCVKDSEISPDAKIIRMSREAWSDFSVFSRKNQLDSKLYARGAADETLCLFDEKLKSEPSMKKRKAYDVIKVTHPLIRWINEKDERASGCSAVEVLSDGSFAPGDYFYRVSRWECKGYKAKKECHYSVCRISDGKMLSDEEAERLVDFALEESDASDFIQADWESLFADGSADRAFTTAQNQEFDKFDKWENGQSDENEKVCKKQLEYINEVFSKKEKSLQERIDKMRREGKERGAELFESQLKKLRQRWDDRKFSVTEAEKVHTSQETLCVGFMRVKRG